MELVEIVTAVQPSAALRRPEWSEPAGRGCHGLLLCGAPHRTLSMLSDEPLFAVAGPPIRDGSSSAVMRRRDQLHAMDLCEVRVQHF